MQGIKLIRERGFDNYLVYKLDPINSVTCEMNQNNDLTLYYNIKSDVNVVITETVEKEMISNSENETDNVDLIRCIASKRKKLLQEQQAMLIDKIHELEHKIQQLNDHNDQLQNTIFQQDKKIADLEECLSYN